ncbi:MAG: DUF4382 domain-containing protein [Candidatus Acidiferrales bacterium]
MTYSLQSKLKALPTLAWIGSLMALVVFAAVLVSCTGSGSSTPMSGTSSINVSITDPPSCKYPNGDFQHVYVTIRSVQAHTSSTAGDNTPGWQELAPQLNNQPMQIDLFAAGPDACLLTMLGSNTALPAGTYQQIRLLLVPNDGSSGPLPATNACVNEGFNCAILQDGSVHELQLSSQANTGLKIPPGQIEGGPITVEAGQDVDLNIDFNACASIIQEGNDQFRLKPVLTAGQVSTNSTGISGHVVDAGTMLPIAGGTVLVALEQPEGSQNDVIFMETVADSGGNFNFCPLPTAATFDVVVVAINGAGLVYNATVAVGVLGGTNLGAIPLTPETGATPGAATLRGFITAGNGSAAASLDASVSALQTITLPSGAALAVTIPAENDSVSNISVDSNADCPATAPMNTNCAQYTLVEPASNPSVGVFSSGKITYSAPPSGDVLYSVGANAFVPLSGGTTDCAPPSKTTNLDANGNPLKVSAGATVTPQEIDFHNCS